MQISFASLFTADAVGASFDASIEAQAMAGRVPAMFIEAVKTHYAVTLPSSPKAAMIAINHMAALSSPLQIVKGAGAKASAAKLMQALYRVGELLSKSPAKGLPALSAIPSWADPVALQAEKDKRKVEKDKRKADKAAKATPVTPEEGEEGEAIASESRHDVAAPVDMAQQIATALALVQAAAKSGQLTQAQWDIIRALADTSAPVAASSKATAEERAAQQTADALQTAKAPKASKSKREEVAA